MEGFLYPDTYRILPTADAYMILDTLLGEWDKKISESYEKLGNVAYENLILASIVEREERKS
jgi:cell division protein YceG involved in septum cleavage